MNAREATRKVADIAAWPKGQPVLDRIESLSALSLALYNAANWDDKRWRRLIHKVEGYADQAYGLL